MGNNSSINQRRALNSRLQNNYYKYNANQNNTQTHNNQHGIANYDIYPVQQQQQQQQQQAAGSSAGNNSNNPANSRINRITPIPSNSSAPNSNNNSPRMAVQSLPNRASISTANSSNLIKQELNQGISTHTTNTAPNSTAHSRSSTSSLFPNTNNTASYNLNRLTIDQSSCSSTSSNNNSATDQGNAASSSDSDSNLASNIAQNQHEFEVSQQSHMFYPNNPQQQNQFKPMNYQSISQPSSTRNSPQHSRSNSIVSSNAGVNPPIHSNNSTPLRTRRLTARRQAKSQSNSNSARNSIDFTGGLMGSFLDLNQCLTNVPFMNCYSPILPRNLDPAINLIMHNSVAMSAIINESFSGTIALKFNSQQLHNTPANSAGSSAGNNLAHYRYIWIARNKLYSQQFCLNWSSVQSAATSLHGSIPLQKIHSIQLGTIEYNSNENTVSNGSEDGENSSCNNCITVIYGVNSCDRIFLQFFNWHQCLEWLFYLNFMKRFTLQQQHMNYNFFNTNNKNNAFDPNCNLYQAVDKLYKYYNHAMQIRKYNHHTGKFNNNSNPNSSISAHEFTARRLMFEREIDLIRDSNRKQLIDNCREMIELQTQIDQIKAENQSTIRDIIQSNSNSAESNELLAEVDSDNEIDEELFLKAQLKHQNLPNITNNHINDDANIEMNIR
jgi:hypothetical protein